MVECCGATMDWLLSPIDPARPHEVEPAVSWHGRVMVLAWGLLLPLGVIAARFFKIMPGQNWPLEVDNQAWWHAHRLLQYAGLTCMALGIGLILLSSGEHSGAALHRWWGWAMVGLASVQLLSAMARGSKGGPTDAGADGSTFGDHYNMTRRRILFEWLHKSLGYLLLLGSGLSITTGLWVANAPRWMWLGQFAVWLALVATYAILQARGRANDTYQAIWGPDPAHPGNHRRPVGWGIRRPSPDANSGGKSIS